MGYLARQSLTARISERVLEELTNDAQLGLGPDEAVITQGLRLVDETIDSYLRQRYPLPLESVPTVLEDVAGQLLVEWLYTRRPEGGTPDQVREGGKLARAALAEIRDGKRSLGLQATQDAQAEGGGKIKVLARPQVFGTDLLDRY